MKKALFISIVFMVFFNCNSNNTNSVSYSVKTSFDVATTEHPGKKLMEMYCYACHNPTSEEGNRLAPPMIAIKKHYINKNTTKEKFIADIQTWIKNPNETDAKMFGAVRRFGIMTKVDYPEADIRLIAEYLYDNTIEQPEWFEQHYKNAKGNPNNN